MKSILLAVEMHMYWQRADRSHGTWEQFTFRGILLHLVLGNEACSVVLCCIHLYCTNLFLWEYDSFPSHSTHFFPSEAQILRKNWMLFINQSFITIHAHNPGSIENSNPDSPLPNAKYAQMMTLLWRGEWCKNSCAQNVWIECMKKWTR